MHTETGSLSSSTQPTKKLQKRIKKASMIAIGTVVSLTTLLGGVVMPIYSFMHLNRNTDHHLLNYQNTVPTYWKFEGVQTKRDPYGGVEGWINPRSENKRYIYNPNYILDINSCLSRSLYNNYSMGYHHRISLCRNYTNPEDYLIRLQLHFGNENGDVFTGGRFGISLTYDEFASIVNMHRWVQDWYFKGAEIQTRRALLYTPTNINNKTGNISVIRPDTDTHQWYKQVQSILTSDIENNASSTAQQQTWRLPPINRHAYHTAPEEERRGIQILPRGG
jgi:hypothetical protein